MAALRCPAPPRRRGEIPAFCACPWRWFSCSLAARLCAPVQPRIEPIERHGVIRCCFRDLCRLTARPAHVAAFSAATSRAAFRFQAKLALLSWRALRQSAPERRSARLSGSRPSSFAVSRSDDRIAPVSPPARVATKKANFYCHRADRAPRCLYPAPIGHRLGMGEDRPND